MAKVKARKPRKPKTIARAASGEKSLGQAFEEADSSEGTDEAPPELAALLDVKPKRARKAKPKKEEKVKKTKTKTKTKKAPSKGKAPVRRKATPAQLKAAKSKIARRDWVKDIANFRKTKSHNNISFEMGTPGSAQVTKARLDKWDGFKGLSSFTSGSKLFVTKLTVAEAKAAAKKAGKL